MNRVLNAVKLDFYAVRPSLRTSAFMFVAAIAIGAVTSQPIITLALVMVFGVFTGSMVFSTHEKNHSEKLYGILPLRKSEMIAGRYLYALAIGAAHLVIAAAFAMAIAKVRDVTLDWTSFWIALGLSFLYYCFATGVSYPIYFKFTYAKAYVFTMLPMYLIVLFTMLILRRKNTLNELSLFLKFFANKSYLAPILGVLGGLALLAFSALAANLIYKRKEI